MWENDVYLGHRAPQSLAIDTDSQYSYPMASTLPPNAFSFTSGGDLAFSTGGLAGMLGEPRSGYDGGGSASKTNVLVRRAL